MSTLRDDLAKPLPRPIRFLAAIAAGTTMVLGMAGICAGAFLAFPLVFTALFWVIGWRLTSFAIELFAGGLALEVIGFGLILIGPRLWSRFVGRV
jgi:hypothetical protein